jgi:hypothetical protein
VLPKWLAVAIKEGLKHNAAFDTFNGGLEAVRPREIADWRAVVTKWESKQHQDNSDSPFDDVEEGVYAET